MLPAAVISADTQLGRRTAMPLFLVLARKFRILIAVPLVCAVATAVICKLSTPDFTATARILPPQYNEATVSSLTSQLGGASDIGNSALTLKNPTDLFVGILGSRTIADAVIARHQLAKHYDESDADNVRKKLAKSTDIHAAKDGIISISVDDRDRVVAAELANAYVAEFYVFAQELAQRGAARRDQFYRRALIQAQGRLRKADLFLTEVENRTGLTRLGGQDGAIIEAAAELQAQIAAREVQLGTMGAYATSTNPDVQLIQRELVNLRAELDRLRSKSSLAGPAPAPDGRMPMVALGDAPDAYLTHAEAKRDVLYWESIVTLLGRYAELGQIDERRDMSLFQVLDTAIPPTVKSKPRTLVDMILAATGSGMMMLIAILVHGYVKERRTGSAGFDSQWTELVTLLSPGHLIAPLRQPWWTRASSIAKHGAMRFLTRRVRRAPRRPRNST
jgi:tyrosine-protein kinase Etk/Wzc